MKGVGGNSNVDLREIGCEDGQRMEAGIVSSNRL
jgi:hypothetical protein